MVLPGYERLILPQRAVIGARSAVRRPVVFIVEATGRTCAVTASF